MGSKLISIFILFLAFKYSFFLKNDRPIIGIVSEEMDEISSFGKSFIMASYVKYVEASGARVIPIRIYQSEKYYRDLLTKLNGVLFPGGDDLLESKGFGRTAEIVFNIAVELNKNGTYFPLWGTCLGFELFNYAAVGGKSWMKICSATDWPTNIDFAKDSKKSRLFSKLSSKLEDSMKRENVVFHLHHWCLTPENYSISGLDKWFKVLATNEDSKGERFISIIEAFDYPFYAVTFHPEKVLFDWSPHNISAPHTESAIKVSQFFANFFAAEARKNHNRFENETEENSLLIYNYNPVLSGNDLSCQKYIFQ